MEPLSNFVSHSLLTINDFPAFVNSQLAKDFSCPKTEFPSVYKGPNGQNGWICSSAALLSIGVRPVRLIQVPCRTANSAPSDSPTSAIGILPIFKADERGVLDVRRLRITPKMNKITWQRRLVPCTLRVSFLSVSLAFISITLLSIVYYVLIRMSRFYIFVTKFFHLFYREKASRTDRKFYLS